MKNAPSRLARYEKIIAVFLKYGFEDVLAHPPLSRFMPENGPLAPLREGRSVFQFTRWERVRLVCEELGTTFIKLAQIAANRPDLLPEDLIFELSKFHDQAAPVAEADIRRTLEEEFAQPLDEIFQFIDFQPIATASIAQVHRARLHDGQEVVLKIQRPDLAETIEADLAIMHQIAGVLERNFPKIAIHQPVELVKMFEKSIRKELNFKLEAGNLERFRKNFEGNKSIVVPRLFSEKSTRRVICMEFIDGIKITDRAALEAIGLSGAEVARLGINLYFEQVFMHGFFHADPHPGNIFILKDRRVCFVDFGQMGTVSERDREMLGEMMLTIVERDMKGLKKVLGSFTERGSLDHAVGLEAHLEEFLDDIAMLGLGEIDSRAVLQTLNPLLFEYKIKPPANLFLLGKAIVIVEGLGRTLNPDYQILEEIKPFVKRLLLKKYGPERLARQLFRTATQLSRFAADLPEDLRDLVQKLRDGRLQIEQRQPDLLVFAEKIERSAGRLALAVVIAGLLIGSMGRPPLVETVGLSLAGLLVVRLFWKMKI